MQKNRWSAVLGLALLLPACAACLSGLLRLSVPGAFIHPILVLGGLCSAFVLNLLPVLRFHAELEEGSLVGAIRLRLGGALSNWAVVAGSLLLTGVIASYLFVENFQPR